MTAGHGLPGRRARAAWAFGATSPICDVVSGSELAAVANAFNKVLYNRELALFYLDHDMKLGEALDLARKELEVRGDIYTHDVLAWALYKNGRAADAVAPMKEALRLGTKDARLWFHAGMIHRAVGEPDKAREYLQRSLATNPHFHILQAEVARRTLRELEGQFGQPVTQE